MNLVVALDPGQRQDPAALVIVERIMLARDAPRTTTDGGGTSPTPSSGHSARRTRRS